MANFAAAHAYDLPAEELVDVCVEQLRACSTASHRLGFVYLTDEVSADTGQIVADLKKKTGVEHWLGTVGLGICASGAEYFGRPAIAVLTCDIDEGSTKILPQLNSAADLKEFSAQDFFAAIGIVHADPRNTSILDLVSNLANDHQTFLVGGLTSAEKNFAQISGTAMECGVSGVLLGGKVQVAVGLTQGCSPIGPPHIVNQSDQNILMTLDGQPAYEILCEDLGVAEGVDPRPWLTNIHAAILVSGSDTGDYLVRNLVGIDMSQGLVAIADAVESGSRVVFVRRDAEAAAKDLHRMLDDLKSRSQQEPKAALYYSCLARGPNLFDEEAFELKTIRKVLGDIPLAGFFGNGEISNDRVYGYTGVLTLFY